MSDKFPIQLNTKILTVMGKPFRIRDDEESKEWREGTVRHYLLELLGSNIEVKGAYGVHAIRRIGLMALEEERETLELPTKQVELLRKLIIENSFVMNGQKLRLFTPWVQGQLMEAVGAGEDDQ